jgi:hypothetical protein
MSKLPRFLIIDCSFKKKPVAMKDLTLEKI